MSDTVAAIAILPFLIALTAVLECSRIGCTKLMRRLSTSSSNQLNQPVGRF